MEDLNSANTSDKNLDQVRVDLAPLLQRGQISANGLQPPNDAADQFESQSVDSVCSTGFPEQSSALGSQLEQVPESSLVLNINSSNNLKNDVNLTDQSTTHSDTNIKSLLQQEFSNNATLQVKPSFDTSDSAEKMLYEETDINPPNFRILENHNKTSSTSEFPLDGTCIQQTTSNNNNKKTTSNSKGTTDITITSYARAVAPPGVQPSTTGSSPDCGVLLERLEGYSLDSYAWAITDVAGKASITYIGRDPRDNDYILVFLKTAAMAQSLVENEVRLRGRWINVSFFQQPAVRLTISGVLPFIPDCLIIDALEDYGSSVYSVLRRIPAAVKVQAFKGASSYRHEIFLVKKDRTTLIPKNIKVTFLGITYDMEISNTGPKCFKCGSTDHLINKCNTLIQNTTNDQSKQQTLEHNSKDFRQNSQPTIPSRKPPSVETPNRLIETTAHTGMNSYSTNKNTSRSYFTQCNIASLPKLGTTQRSEDDIPPPTQTNDPAENHLNFKIGVNVLKRSSGFVLNKTYVKNTESQPHCDLTDSLVTVTNNEVKTSSVHNPEQFDQNPSSKKKKHDPQAKSSSLDSHAIMNTWTPTHPYLHLWKMSIVKLLWLLLFL